MSGNDAGRPGPAPSVRAGIGLYLVAMALFISTDTLAKLLLATHAIAFIAWVRFCVQFGLLFALAPGPRLARLRARRHALLWLRTGAWISVTFLFYAGLRHVPLAESIMLVNTAPFMIALLAGPCLGERMARTAWAAVAVGFAGTIVVLRPGFGALHWAAIFPLLTAAGFSLTQIVTRRLSIEEDHWTILLYTAGLGALLLTPFGLAAWSGTTLLDWTLLASVGVLAAAADTAMLAALRRAPASTLAPVQYSQILWAMLAGLVVFAEFPDRFAVAGAAVIVAGGLLLWRAARPGAAAARKPRG